ncbi:MAG: lipoprotein signal peptidase [Caulobacteraceae bacterium]|nr:lipoprotein signal peptidase [Caulobacteraceae bacterium]
MASPQSLAQARGLILFLVLAGLVILADQTLKAWVLSTISEGASLRLGGPVDFTLVFNHSNAFGLAPVAGQITRWALAALNLGVVAAFIVAVGLRSIALLTLAGMALIAGGAAGNAIDRMRLGVVVDFLDASKLGFDWVFNIADASIDAGIALWILSTVLSQRQSAST